MLVVFLCLFFFFFKQKTAYEMRISDWSSDVCSSDLGVVTDANGTYKIQLPDGSGTLVFSFVGYTPQEVEVGFRSTIAVSLAQEATQINEVVVTALGIEREKQSLGYATQRISGDHLNQKYNTTFNSLIAGTIAGLEVKRT